MNTHDQLNVIIVLLLVMSGVFAAIIEVLAVGLFFGIFVGVPLILAAVALYYYPQMWAWVGLFAGYWLFDTAAKVWKKQVAMSGRLGALAVVNLALCILGATEVYQQHQQEPANPYAIVPCTVGPITRMSAKEFEAFINYVNRQLPPNRTREQFDAAIKAQLPRSCESESKSSNLNR